MSLRITLTATVLLLAPVLSSFAQAPNTVKLTLSQAIDLALKNNHALLIGGAKVAEKNSAARVVAGNYYPQVTSSSSYLHYTQTSLLQFSEGAFGNFPGLGPLPGKNLVLNQGTLDHVLSRNEVAQPLTQLFKIHAAHRAARAEELAAGDDLENLREQVALGVRQLYYALLINRLDADTAAEQTRTAEQQLADATQDVAKGNALEVTHLKARTALLQAREEALSAHLRKTDLLAQFKDTIGLPQSAAVELDDTLASPPDLPTQEDCTRLAQSQSPAIRSAEQTVHETEAAVSAAKAEYIPDITAFGRHEYQDGVAFLFHNYGVVGFGMTFTLFDGGKRRAQVAEREAQRTQALENLRRLKDEAAVNVQKAFDKIETSRSLLEVAHEAVAVAEESNRLSAVQLRFEEIVASKRSEAAAALSKARADLLKAQLGFSESQAELAILIGRLPR